jgi:hypothetical protein
LSIGLQLQNEKRGRVSFDIDVRHRTRATTHCNQDRARDLRTVETYCAALEDFKPPLDHVHTPISIPIPTPKPDSKSETHSSHEYLHNRLNYHRRHRETVHAYTKPPPRTRRKNGARQTIRTPGPRSHIKYAPSVATWP